MKKVLLVMAILLNSGNIIFTDVPWEPKVRSYSDFKADKNLCEKEKSRVGSYIEAIPEIAKKIDTTVKNKAHTVKGREILMYDDLMKKGYVEVFATNEQWIQDNTELLNGLFSIMDKYGCFLFTFAPTPHMYVKGEEITTRSALKKGGKLDEGGTDALKEEGYFSSLGKFDKGGLEAPYIDFHIIELGDLKAIVLGATESVCPQTSYGDPETYCISRFSITEEGLNLSPYTIAFPPPGSQLYLTPDWEIGFLGAGQEIRKGAEKKILKLFRLKAGLSGSAYLLRHIKDGKYKLEQLPML